MQARIEVDDLDAPETAAEITAAVQDLPGVKAVTVVKTELHVIYDPLQITEREIEENIRKRGHHPLSGESERESPLADL